MTESANERCPTCGSPERTDKAGQSVRPEEEERKAASEAFEAWAKTRALDWATVMNAPISERVERQRFKNVWIASWLARAAVTPGNERCPLCDSPYPRVFYTPCAAYNERGEPAHVFHWEFQKAQKAAVTRTDKEE